VDSLSTLAVSSSSCCSTVTILEVRVGGLDFPHGWVVVVVVVVMGLIGGGGGCGLVAAERGVRRQIVVVTEQYGENIFPDPPP
jgi:hypothetical protein